MTATPTVNAQQYAGERERLKVLEKVARGRATVDIGATALAVDTNADWFEQAAAKMETGTPVKADATDTGDDWIADWADGTPDGFTLAPGRYKATFILRVTNTSATEALTYAWGLVDDAATPVAIVKQDTAGVGLPASTQNFQAQIVDEQFFTLSARTNVNFVAALRTASSTGTHVQGGVSRLVIERVG